MFPQWLRQHQSSLTKKGSRMNDCTVRQDKIICKLGIKGLYCSLGLHRGAPRNVEWACAGSRAVTRHSSSSLPLILAGFPETLLFSFCVENTFPLLPPMIGINWNCLVRRQPATATVEFSNSLLTLAGRKVSSQSPRQLEGECENGLPLQFPGHVIGPSYSQVVQLAEPFLTSFL
jgi:hypothetical protein